MNRKAILFLLSIVVSTSSAMFFLRGPKKPITAKQIRKKVYSLIEVVDLEKKIDASFFHKKMKEYTKQAQNLPDSTEKNELLEYIYEKTQKGLGKDLLRIEEATTEEMATEKNNDYDDEDKVLAERLRKLRDEPIKPEKKEKAIKKTPKKKDRQERKIRAQQPPWNEFQKYAQETINLFKEQLKVIHHDANKQKALTILFGMNEEIGALHMQTEAYSNIAPPLNYALLISSIENLIKQINQKIKLFFKKLEPVKKYRRKKDVN